MIRTIATAVIACLAVCACVKHNPSGHRVDPDHGGGHDGKDELVLRERTDWTIRYVARENWVNDDGSVDRVEHFKFAYTGSTYYIIRFVRPEDFRDAYNSDAAAFFTYEAESLLKDAKADGVDFWQYTDEVFAPAIKDVYFNRLRSGTWTAFLVELDGKGAVTGNYAEETFTISEEDPSDAYLSWLGRWEVTNGRVGYELTVSPLDNNYLYRVDGWECGEAAGDFQMDQEYLETEFWAPDGCMYFISQFLGSYEDEKFGTVDELFLGRIFDSGGYTVITDEGLDLAVASFTGDKAELRPMNVTLSTSGGDYTTTFDSMLYYMWVHSSEEYVPYHSNAARLPLTMTRVPGTKASAAPLAKERSATRPSIHHLQPKAARGARNSVAKKAVRMK